MTNNTTPAKTYYLTKYALSSKGVITAFQGKPSEFNDGYISDIGSRFFSSYKLGRDVHESAEAAIVAADFARIKKIVSLKKQIAALEKLAFTVEESE